MTGDQMLDDAVTARRLLVAMRKAVRLDDLDELTHEERTDLWVALKRAANAAYGLCKDLDRLLLAEAGRSRGWVASDGTSLTVARRFEVELVDEDAFAAWCADRGVDPFETTVKVTAEARKAVREALFEDGEKAPGVDAGEGTPYLTLGRGGPS